MTDRSHVLYAPCSEELLKAAQAHATERDMTLGGLIRQAVAAALGLPAGFSTKPAKDTQSKKRLAKARRRG